MKEQLTERGDKCDENQQSQVTRAQAEESQLKKFLRKKSDVDTVSVQAILIYCLLTLIAYPGFFASVSHYVMADSFLGGFYFLYCALICLVSISYILHSCMVRNSKPLVTQKITSVVLLLLVVENVFMALDSVSNLEQWITLDLIDTIIHGHSEWIVPLGMSDLAFLIIGISCFINLPSRGC